jgi:hypothetical protein
MQSRWREMRDPALAGYQANHQRPPLLLGVYPALFHEAFARLEKPRGPARTGSAQIVARRAAWADGR